MKRIGVIALFVLLSISFAVAAEDDLGEVPFGSQAEKINNGIEEFAPLDDRGDFDEAKFEKSKSAAEKRIDAINSWVETNAPWLAIIFGMVPALSWLFAVNIWVMLFFATIVFNLGGTKLKIGGWIVYVVLLITKIYVLIAEGLFSLLKGLFENSWIIAVLVLILIGTLQGFIPKLLGMISKKDPMEETQEKAEQSQKELAAYNKGVQGKGFKANPGYDFPSMDFDKNKSWRDNILDHWKKKSEEKWGKRD